MTGEVVLPARPEPPVRRGEAHLPNDLSAEQALLGSLLIDPRAIDRVSSRVSVRDFYLPVHADLYRAALRIRDQGKPVDIRLLTDHLDAQDELDRMGGEGYILSLAALVPTSINAEHYADIVREHGTNRGLIGVGHKAAALGYDERIPSSQALDEAQEALDALKDSAAAGRSRGPRPLSAILSEIYDDYAEMRERGDEVTGLGTGFTDLDRMTSGFQPEDLIILAGRTSTGKSALAECVIHHVAVKSRSPVLFFSLEMSEKQAAHRLICLQSNVPSQRLRTGRMSELEWGQFNTAVGILNECPITVDGERGASVTQIRDRARRLHEQRPLGLIVVDYLQFVKAGGKHDNRVQEIAAITGGLRNLAGDLKVPVLALAQLNRQMEQRTDHRPLLSDLRESGSVEQDSDVVLFLYRPSLYDREASPYLTELIVAKQRNGPTGTVKLFWHDDLMKFSDLSARESPYE